mmetsp:Transcript_23829/g.32518  ORF Transcript_23829/g.32518 Transcript_23829/m.32518 type:complete len:95 (-) Transcript_23829:44-328(-)
MHFVCTCTRAILLMVGMFMRVGDFFCFELDILLCIVRSILFHFDSLFTFFLPSAFSLSWGELLSITSCEIDSFTNTFVIFLNPHFLCGHQLQIV